MIFFYNSANALNLKQFGIQIPFQESQWKKTVAFIKKNLNQNCLIDLDECILKPLSKNDLCTAHNQSYVDKIFGSYEDKINVVETCYELVHKDGSYYRYKPDQANESLDKLIDCFLMQGAGLKHALIHAHQNKTNTYYLGGGFHHAMDFSGRGFCLINDIVIAIRSAQQSEKIESVWVIDVDAHKGDGTAQITQDDASIKTLSIHMKTGWPLEDGQNKNEPWFIPSDIDIPIAKNEEDIYLKKLEQGLLKMQKEFDKPDLVIIVQGADPYIKDALTSSSDLKLNLRELLKRDTLIYSFFKEMNVPQIYCMSGGYGPDASDVYINFINWLKKGCYGNN